MVTIRVGHCMQNMDAVESNARFLCLVNFLCYRDYRKFGFDNFSVNFATFQVDQKRCETGNRSEMGNSFKISANHNCEKFLKKISAG